MVPNTWSYFGIHPPITGTVGAVARGSWVLGGAELATADPAADAIGAADAWGGPRRGTVCERGLV